MRRTPTIVKAYTRYYSDNGQLKAYVEWSNGSRTEGEAGFYHGVPIPCGTHMGLLFDRALHIGLTIGRETW
jgi:hypothetical protein